MLREKVKFLAGFDLSPHAMAVGRNRDPGKDPDHHHECGDGVDHARSRRYFVRVSMTIPQHVDAAGAMGRQARASRRSTRIVSDYAPGHDAENYFIKDVQGGRRRDHRLSRARRSRR